MKKNIIFIDTETGGIDPNESSLLSIGLVLWSEGEILDKKELFLKQGIYKVTAQALNVNKINLQELIKVADEPMIVINAMISFRDKYFNDTNPPVLGGHNTMFDIGFLRKLFSDYNVDFNKYFSHRFVDTSAILKYLYYAGVLENDISSSDKAFQYFNIKVGERHTALADAEATATLFSLLINLIKGHNL